MRALSISFLPYGPHAALDDGRKDRSTALNGYFSQLTNQRASVGASHLRCTPASTIISAVAPKTPLHAPVKHLVVV